MSVVAPRQTHERIFSPLRQRKIVLFTSSGNIIGYNKSSTEMLGTASKKTYRGNVSCLHRARGEGVSHADRKSVV